MTGARDAALEALRATVDGGRFLDEALDTALAGERSVRERALARDLAYGACRHWFRLVAIRDSLLERPLRSRDGDVATAICLGLYQLIYSRIPAHAAVAETVSLAARRKGWARGLVNAVLRRFQREREARLAAVDRDDVARLSHPRWLLDALARGWPERWQEVALAGNERAPMTLRVNTGRWSRDEAARRLAQEGFQSRPGRFCDDALVLEAPADVAALPGFGDGMLSVQDEAAQIAADLLEVSAGQSLLDACAAPGGKLAHVLERTRGEVDAVALDRDPARVARLADTLSRLGLEARLECADARDGDGWWRQRRFDRILLDAPCSATGVIRRHPDIKLHRTPGDLERLPLLQLELLTALWPLLARDGRLLYATCSVLPEENAATVQRFLSAHADARAADLEVPWGVAAAPGRQILPGESGMDGFYYALLVKC